MHNIYTAAKNKLYFTHMSCAVFACAARETLSCACAKAADPGRVNHACDLDTSCCGGGASSDATPNGPTIQPTALDAKIHGEKCEKQVKQDFAGLID